jgi:uncharacterized protein YdhG (YjbR/CyaY superfamily)
MQSKAQSVPAYLKELPADQKKVLTQLRKLVRDEAPTAVESMRYGMPCYELGEMICAFAAQKQHFAFYLTDNAVVEQYRPQLGKLNIGKGCIRFRKPEELNFDLLRQMLALAVKRRLDGVTMKPCEE